MKAIILAAGMGSRLGKYTKNNTKAMVEVNGRRLIEYSLDSLKKVNINEAVIVVGYEKENLKNFLGDTYKDIKIKYIENNIYNETNNIYSFYLAKEEFDDDIILLESDIIFEHKIIQDLVEDENKDLVLVDKYEKWMDGTVTVLDKYNTISQFVDKSEFDWNKTKDYYKTVNIYKFSKEFLNNKYVPFLEAHIKSEGVNSYYEQVLKVITALKSVELKAKKVYGQKWYEIDDAQDLDIAETLFKENDELINGYQKRYGGFWRFPKLKDFCYLVNPYFPTDRMKEEIKSSFDVLLSEYPSGLNIQNLLAAKLFDCDKDEIVVGNGAAELIKALAENLKGKSGIICPTFNEYAERIGLNNVEYFDTSKQGYSYSIEDLIKFSEKIDNLVLINPDNPSGHYLSKDEVLSLAEHLNKKGKKLIIDESFIDFAGKEKIYSLIDSDIMNKYKNLVIIKSISKSYGVPGLRLGVLASGDEQFLQNIKSGVSIWNINSFGEYFMQIIGKYKEDYKKACILIAEERDRFYQELNEISFLEVIPSKSNYFLCKVKSLTSKELTKKLLQKDNIFIKDCQGKMGFEQANYVRIAVRNKQDNDYILQALKNIEQINPK